MPVVGPDAGRAEILADGTFAAQDAKFEASIPETAQMCGASEGQLTATSCRGQARRVQTPPAARSMLGRRVAMIVLATAAASVLALAGCGDDDAAVPSDAGASLDATERDARAGDADTRTDDAGDAGAASHTVCGPCRRDSDCGGDALCLVLAGGQRGCGVACEVDADCTALAVPSQCLEEAAGLPRQCKPTAGTCVVSPPGADCTVTTCSGRYDVCGDFGLEGRICTARCSVDADCPLGMHRCAPTGASAVAVCVPDPDPAPERCDALVEAGMLARCDGAGSCAAGLTCLGTGAHTLCVSPPRDGGPTGELCDVGSPTVLPSGAHVCLPHECACVLSDPGSMLDDALAALSRDRCDLHFSSAVEDSFGLDSSRDPYRLRLTDDARGYWPEALALADRVATTLDCGGCAGGVPNLVDALTSAASYTDLVVPAAASAPPVSLEEALVSLVARTGGTPDTAAIHTAVVALDAMVATRVAPIVSALERAYLEREAALARIGAERERAFESPSSFIVGGVRAPDLRRSADRGVLLGDVDVGRMVAGAVQLATAIREADLPAIDGHAGSLRVDTPIGAVAIGGPGDDTYDDTTWHATALLVELGGDDTYRFPVGATTDADHGIAVVIDLGGIDDYGYDVVASPGDMGPAGSHRLPSDAEGRMAATALAGPATRSTTGRQGSGRLGIGMLLDLGPEADHYRSLRMSQGYGALGVGVLWDAGGDDTYEGEAAVQGAASFGIGLLYDMAGDDHYVAYSEAQGFAFVRAFGALYDRDGNDDYVADPADVLYYSPQDATSNTSLAQGVGLGRRADTFADGQYMSGGLGVLRDRRGTDHYTCSIYGEGSGYWYGTGLLLEGGGDDTFDGRWYVQGSGAHSAVALLVDEDGADLYTARFAASIGVGHDFSIGWLVDRAGSDEYHGPGFSFGAGNAAGVGFFVDLAGADRYEAGGGLSFGNASIEMPGDLRRRMTGTYGLFFDADGVDTYSRPMLAPVANDTTWTQRSNGPDDNELGAGIDRSGGRLGL